MKSKLIFLVLVVMFAGCRPKGILSTQQMEDVLYDLHMADGVLQESGLAYGHDDALRAYYQVVLDKHGVTQAQVDSSLVWYTDHPQFFDKMYPKILDRLNAERERVEAMTEEENMEKNE